MEQERGFCVIDDEKRRLWSSICSFDNSMSYSRSDMLPADTREIRTTGQAARTARYEAQGYHMLVADQHQLSLYRVKLMSSETLD